MSPPPRKKPCNGIDTMESSRRRPKRSTAGQNSRFADYDSGFGSHTQAQTSNSPAPPPETPPVDVDDQDEYFYSNVKIEGLDEVAIIPRENVIQKKKRGRPSKSQTQAEISRSLPSRDRFPQPIKIEVLDEEEDDDEVEYILPVHELPKKRGRGRPPKSLANSYFQARPSSSLGPPVAANNEQPIKKKRGRKPKSALLLDDDPEADRDWNSDQVSSIASDNDSSSPSESAFIVELVKKKRGRKPKSALAPESTEEQPTVPHVKKKPGRKPRDPNDRTTPKERRNRRPKPAIDLDEEELASCRQGLRKRHSKHGERTDYMSLEKEPDPITVDDLPHDMPQEEKEKLIHSRVQQISNYRERMRREILNIWSDGWTGPDDSERSGAKTKYPPVSAIRLADGVTFQCPSTGCQKKFSTRQGFNYHYKRCLLVAAAAGEDLQKKKLYRCRFCPTVEFIQKIGLLAHLNQLHRADLPEIPEAWHKYLTINRPPAPDSKPIYRPGNMLKSFKTSRPLKTYGRYGIGVSCVSVSEVLKTQMDLYGEPFTNHSKFGVKLSDWSRITDLSELESYLPKRSKSIRFKIGSQSYSEAIQNDVYVEHGEWIFLRRFESIIGLEQCITFFAGGQVTAADWLPYPPDTQFNLSSNTSHKLIPLEYLALAQQTDTDKTFKYCDKAKEEGEDLDNEENDQRGIIQLWACSELNVNFSRKASMRLAMAMTHEWGRVNALKWAPLGSSYEYLIDLTQEDLPSGPERRVKRLGLLAAACSDSYIRLLAVPHPEVYAKEIGCEGVKGLYMRVEPCLVLVPPEKKLSPHVATTGAALCLDWSQNQSQKIIVAGYGGGLVCVWNILNDSQATNVISRFFDQEQQAAVPPPPPMISPILAWEAHLGPVTSISLAPPHLENYLYESDAACSLILVTGSLDRSVHLWNLAAGAELLHSINSPQEITSVAWMPGNDPGLLVGTDDALVEAAGKNHVQLEFLDPDTRIKLRCKNRWVMLHSASVNAIAMNDLLGCSVSVDSSGEVSLAIHVAKVRTKDGRRRVFDRIPLFRIDPRRLPVEERRKSHDSDGDENDQDEGENYEQDENEENEPGDEKKSKMVILDTEKELDDYVDNFLASNLHESDPEEEFGTSAGAGAAGSSQAGDDGNSVVGGDVAAAAPTTQVINADDCIPAEANDESFDTDYVKGKGKGKTKNKFADDLTGVRNLRPPPNKATIPPDVPPLDTYRKWTRRGWGVKFLDNKLTRASTFPQKELERIVKDDDPKHGFKSGVNHYRPLDYPMTAAQLAVWNPNASARSWLFVSTGSGLCRLVCAQMLT